MKVTKKEGAKGVVSTGGLRREVNFSLLPAAKRGDYVLVHAGFAIGKINEAEAKKTLELFRGALVPAPAGNQRQTGFSSRPGREPGLS